MPIPIFAFIGIAVFLAILVFALISYSRGGPKPQQVQQVQQTWRQNNDAYLNTPYYAANTSSQPMANPAPIAPSAPAYMSPAYTPPGSVGTQQRYAAANPFAPGVWKIAPRVQAVSSYDRNLEGYALNSSIYFQNVEISLIVQGSQRELVGTVVLVNDTQSTLDDGTLWLSLNGTQCHLQRFEGDPLAPHLLGPFAVAARDSIICNVMVKDFKGDGRLSVHKTVGLDAKIAGAPVHHEQVIG